VPADILEKTRNRSEETQESHAAATEARGTKYLDETRRLLLNQFPMMPQRDLEAVLKHSFAKGSGRVGRDSTLPDRKRAELAAEAHIRHHRTPYDTIIESGMPQHLAHNRAMTTAQGIQKKLGGECKEPIEVARLTLRLG